MSNRLDVAVIGRTRMLTDGEGVTSLIVTKDCPLRCKYCINPYTWNYDNKVHFERLTKEELYDRVKIDNLYFLATGGGLTFGGGEPLLHFEFIADFIRQYKATGWKFNLETSLNVPYENLERLFGLIDYYLVDCKDMREDIYKKYTGISGQQMLKNLEALIRHEGADKICVRVPRISGYNTQEDVDYSVAALKGMGIRKLDVFAYVDPVKKTSLLNE